MNILQQAFDNQPIIKLKNTNYIVTSLLDHVPETSYDLFNAAIEGLESLTDLTRADKIVAEEDRGGYLAATLAYKAVGCKGEVSIDFRNAYTRGKMYLNGVKKGDKIILVEDIIDSGGTIISMIHLLEKIGAVIVDIICLAEKEEIQGAARIKKETGYEPKFLFKFNCLDEKSRVIK
jgi:adenine phosphoribosyltransferase